MCVKISQTVDQMGAASGNYFKQQGAVNTSLQQRSSNKLAAGGKIKVMVEQSNSLSLLLVIDQHEIIIMTVPFKTNKQTNTHIINECSYLQVI